MADNRAGLVAGLPTDLADDAELAARLALATGQLLMAVRDAHLVDGRALGKLGDAVANRFLVDALRLRRPGDGLLSEEELDSPARLAKSRVWIVDPVDGTREYGEIGPAGPRADWAVHVGLAVDGVATVGAVALPALGVVLRSDRPVAIPPPPPRLRMAVSRTRPARETIAVAARLDVELVPMGSAGAKAMAILRNEADIYLHSGGQYEWDSCAPAAVAMAHGLHASRIDGSPLKYNCVDAYLPDLLICRREHAEYVLAEVRALG